MIFEVKAVVSYKVVLDKGDYHNMPDYKKFSRAEKDSLRYDLERDWTRQDVRLDSYKVELIEV